METPSRASSDTTDGVGRASVSVDPATASGSAAEMDISTMTASSAISGLSASAAGSGIGSGCAAAMIGSANIGPASDGSGIATGWPPRFLDAGDLALGRRANAASACGPTLARNACS